MASAEIGSILAGQDDPNHLQELAKGAENLGLAFQIKDDIFDYMPTVQLGNHQATTSASTGSSHSSMPLDKEVGMHRGGKDTETPCS